MSASVAETVVPGDLVAGDVIALPGTGTELLVESVRLGQGGFILAVSTTGAAEPGDQQVITLTAATPVLRRHRTGAGSVPLPRRVQWLRQPLALCFIAGHLRLLRIVILGGNCFVGMPGDAVSPPGSV